MVLAAIAAQKIGRPVKVAADPAAIVPFGLWPIRHPSARAARRRQRRPADRQSRRTASSARSRASQFFEPVALGSISLYAGKARQFTTRIVPLNLTPAGAVRAPGEAVGMMGLETAMDEMAEALGLDPIAFRKLNEPDVDPMRGAPFSTRRLVDCYDEGARRFGWDKRVATPGSVRDGEWMVGLGMATAARVNFLADSAGAGAADARRRRRGRDRHDRYRHRHLYDPGPGRGGVAGAADRSGAGDAGRFRSAAGRGIGRIVRRGVQRLVGRPGVRGRRRRAGAADGRPGRKT